MSTDNHASLIPTFKLVSTKNPAKSLKAGRPIYEDVEICTIRFAADRNRTVDAPADSIWKYAECEPVTYAQRFPEQYQRFKDKAQQIVEGTPLEELPFIAQARRMELKALGVHTAEALASLEGQPLKNIGPGGRELKNQVLAYLDKAKGSADVTGMAAKIAALEGQLEEQKKLTGELTTRLQGKTEKAA